MDVVTRIDFRVSGPLDAPRLVEAGRDRARIKLNQHQKDAVDAVAPGLPAKEVTPSCSIPSIRARVSAEGMHRAGDFPRPPNPS